MPLFQDYFDAAVILTRILVLLCRDHLEDFHSQSFFY